VTIRSVAELPQLRALIFAFCSPSIGLVRLCAQGAFCQRDAQ
jgi:hypothetical protein